MQKSTFDIDACAAAIINAAELRAEAASNNRNRSYILPLFFRRKGVITDIDTINHRGRPFHICNKSTNIAFQAHLLVGLLCEKCPNVGNDVNFLKEYYRSAVDFLSGVALSSENTLQTKLAEKQVPAEIIKDFSLLFRRFLHDYIQCVELELSDDEGIVILKVKNTDAHWHISNPHRPHSPEHTTHTQGTDASREAAANSGTASESDYTEPNTLEWNFSSATASGCDDSRDNCADSLPPSTDQAPVADHIQEFFPQQQHASAITGTDSLDLQADEFRPNIQVQLGLKSPEIGMPLEFDPAHFNTVHFRILAPEGMNIQSAIIVGNRRRRGDESTDTGDSSISSDSATKDDQCGRFEEVQIPKEIYKYQRHHERAVFQLFSANHPASINTPFSEEVTPPYRIRVRFDPNRAEFLYPLMAIVSLTTLFSLFALLAATFAPDSFSGQASGSTNSGGIPPWNASFAAFLIAPLSIALVFFGRRDDGDYIRRIYSYHRIGFFILVALSSASSASMALIRLGPDWKNIAQAVLIANLLISLAFLMLLGFHTTRIFFIVQMRKYGMVDTFENEFEVAMTRLTAGYFFWMLLVWLLTFSFLIVLALSGGHIPTWHAPLTGGLVIIFLLRVSVGVEDLILELRTSKRDQNSDSINSI